MYLSKVCYDNFTVLQWNLGDTLTLKDGWGPRVKTEKPDRTGSTELLITIANLTALDTGFYHCEYIVYKDLNMVKTSGAGSVLLVVHGELYFEFATHHYVYFLSVPHTGSQIQTS